MEEKKYLEELEKLNRSLRQIYSRTPNWIFTCRNDAGWTLVQSNGHIVDFTGYDKEEFARICHNSIESIIPDSYKAMVLEKTQWVVEQGYGAMTTYEVQIIQKKGSRSWIKINLYWDQTDEGAGIFYVSCDDINNLKEKERILTEKNTMYRLTTENANLNLWTYDVQNDVMHNTDFSSKIHNDKELIPDFVSTTLASGIVREDSIEDFKRMYRKLRAGQESVTADIWLYNKQAESWWCERINYAQIFDDEGCPLKAFGLGRDITELKSAKMRLHDEYQLQRCNNNENLLLKARCNVSRDQVEYLFVKNEMKLPMPAAQYTGGVQQLVEYAYSRKDQIKVGTMLSRAKLEEVLGADGQYSFDYQRKNRQGRAAWVNVIVRVLQQPETKDILAFIYIYDVDRERTMTSVVNRISDIDYEVLALIYIDIDQIEQVRTREYKNNISVDFSKTYSQGISELIDNYVLEEEREEARYALSLQTIVERLEEYDVYEVAFGIHNNRFFQKKWEFTYFDDTKNTIIFNRTDVTTVFREQELQKEVLRNALLQAEEASKAKTNFLSRMSHEIRTPMNAIIGMNTLALQSIDNQEQVLDCLAKVGISARFLLALINDILDMSRIESGKVTIKKERFQLDELVHSINSIFYEQAEQKGIDYDCIIASYVSDYYIGDAMKLQQILVNLLGNAIKFTRSGGKVQLIIRQESEKDGSVYMAFSVNDTGVGISEEFQKVMFEPFEQGDTSITTPYKGTGLGLAIAKNLATMMNGTITVNSIEGVGTEFIVRIPLEKCKDEQYSTIQMDVSLEKLNTLIVDDDIMVCEHTQGLLEEIGIRAEWVESGFRAIETVQSRKDKREYYDVILLDWKMPDMDGIETARRIRRIVGEDVTIIVMTAYDWAEIEEAAKQAGVNLLITKPLFKGTLISAFETAFHKQTEKKRVVTSTEYDFTGRNILLVEDHILNVEVAKRLLTAKNANVVVAENGIRAIECYTEAEDGYYDAILMDIRMPLMDGLTATKSIRHLSKPSAKTVPIIAMSANAFDEDVEKSRSAGMNEHLSKPIEPHVLYATLNRWFQERE